MIDDPMLYEQNEEPADAGFFTPTESEEPQESKIQRLISSINIAQDLSSEELARIGARCFEGYQVDEKSREAWLEQTKSALALAKQVAEQKTTPWVGAANVKLPLITDATIKFAARAYSEIIRDSQVVKAKVVGADPEGQKELRAERVGTYMSWQLMELETEWEPDTDKLLHALPVVGHMFRKRYYCTAEKRTRSELCMPDKIAINQQASSLESARRITHVIDSVSQNDVISNQRAGVWLDIKLREQKNELSNGKDLLEDEDYYTILEQHCWLDLDGDTYEEPYIVTFEKDSMKVVRIVANYDESSINENERGEIMRITPKQCFTDYIFIPSLDGSYYGCGFGHFMEPLNKVANTLVNQLLDCGTLNNINGGYLSKEVKISSGSSRFEVGEWKRTSATADQLQGGIFPLPTKEPSPTLFNLLGLVMDLIRDISSVKDVLAGDATGANMPATTVMALIEQGMKTFNAIYKRIYRSLKKEYKQLYALNFEYMDQVEYFTVMDEQAAIYKADFEPNSLDVMPVADPNMSSDMQRLVRAESLKGAIGAPGVDPRPIMKHWLETLKIPAKQIAEILPEKDPNGIPPNVQAMMHEAEMKMADVQNKERELEIKEREIDLKERELELKALESVSKAVLNFANAESAEAGSQLSAYQALANSILQGKKLESQIAKAQRSAHESAEEQPTQQEPPQMALSE